jgi:hypothetical protein
MLWLNGQLISLKTMTKKWPVTKPLEFEPLSVRLWTGLPTCQYQKLSQIWHMARAPNLRLLELKLALR